jgi:hypothetical protein
MMTRLRHAFTRDLGRKLLALLLAMLVWWRVNLSIEHEDSIDFVITTTGSISNAAHTIEIAVPEGWKLVAPSPGSIQTVKVYGVNADVQSFRQAGVDAEFSVSVSPSTEVGTSELSTVSVEYEDLDWFDSVRAEQLLARAKNEEPLRLTLERIGQDNHFLALTSLKFIGEVASGFETDFDEIEFSPSSVEIRGPRTEVNKYRKDPSEWGQPLFEPVALTDHRSSVRAELVLSQHAINAGLSIRPESVEVIIPVYPIGLSPFDLTPLYEDIALIGKPTVPGSRWQAQDYTGTGFKVVYRHHPDIDPMPDAGDLRDSIVFFVHLSELPAGAGDGQVLPVNWAIRDPAGVLGDQQRLQALKHAITLIPLSEALGSDLILRKLE